MVETAAVDTLLPPRSVGQRVERKEDHRLTTGHGRYVGDIKLAGMLHAAVLRSPFAHAQIKGIDASRALEMKGVVAFFSAKDLEGKVSHFPEPALTDLNPIMYQVIELDIKSCPMEALPRDRVYWVGQPVGLVVAESRYVAEDALEQIEVDYEPLPTIANIHQGLADGAPILHEALQDNVQQRYFTESGDVDAAFRNAERTLSARLEMGRQVANAMEPRGLLAAWDPFMAEMTVWSTTIRPHLLQSIISEMMDLPTEHVRVIGQDIGGSFGSGMFNEEIMIPFASHQLGRPVKWIEDRREDLQNTRHARDQVHDVEVAFDGEGRILGLRDRFKVDFGAYNNYAITVSYNVASHFRAGYKIDDFSIECIGVVTNKAPCAPVRGAGRPEATFVMDRVVDMIADAVSRDPAEVRFRNLIPADAMPYEMGVPYRDGRTVVYDRCDFSQQLRRALDLFDYDGWRRRQSEGRADGRRIGIGMSSFVEGSGVGPHEGAVIKVDLSGHVTVATGAQPHGQGLETTLAQVAADQLGVDPADVSVRHGDTSVIAHGVGTFASRSAVTAGNAVAVAAARLRNKILRVAGTLLEVDVQDLQLEGGLVFPRGAAGRALHLGEIAKAAAPGPRNSVPPGMDPGLQIEYYFYPPTVTWASGTNVVAAEVDEETGFVKLLDYVSVDDCGRMLNPMVVEGQIHGGIAHGIGNAMLEEALYDDDGQFLNATYMDYLLPTSAEVPPIRVDHQEFLSELNPLGVKGVGEGGAVSPPAAIANAVVDAFRPLKVEITRAPITPESVLQAIMKAKQTSLSEL